MKTVYPIPVLPFLLIGFQKVIITADTEGNDHDHMEHNKLEKPNLATGNLYPTCVLQLHFFNISNSSFKTKF